MTCGAVSGTKTPRQTVNSADSVRVIRQGVWFTPVTSDALAPNRTFCLRISTMFSVVTWQILPSQAHTVDFTSDYLCCTASYSGSLVPGIAMYSTVFIWPSNSSFYRCPLPRHLFLWVLNLKVQIHFTGFVEIIQISSIFQPHHPCLPCPRWLPLLQCGAWPRLYYWSTLINSGKPGLTDQRGTASFLLDVYGSLNTFKSPLRLG